MLENYEKEIPLPSEEFIRIDHLKIRNFILTVFQALGVSVEIAYLFADVLLTADLAGISSHGIQRLRRYVDGIKTGNINVRANMKVISDNKAVSVIDANNGLGQVAASKAMDLAIKKASEYGIGLTLVRNSTHFGIAGYYAMKAVNNGFIGMASTNSMSLVAYTNTLGRTLGTNPISIGIPRSNPPPILFDAATSVVPVGKIELYNKLSRKIPVGWVIDKFGSDCSGGSNIVFKKIEKENAAILPLGGLNEEFGGHKGSGLAFLVDVICGILSGAAWSTHVGYMGSKLPNVGHTLLAIDISTFMLRDEFFERIEKYVQEIKSKPLHSKADKIWIPGEKSWLTTQTRMKIGIPIYKTIYEDLKDMAEELEVSWTL